MDVLYRDFHAPSGVEFFICVLPCLVYLGACAGVLISGIQKRLRPEQERKNKVEIWYAVFRVCELFLFQTLAHVYFQLWFTSRPLEGLRVFLGVLVVDTMEYFFHRLYHAVPYLYSNFHKEHHQFVCPHPVAALYNSRLEAFTTSAPIFIVFWVCGFTFPEYITVTCIAYLATVYEHTYTGNTNRHHWIHHATNGQTNFQQPVFSAFFWPFWDEMLGTVYEPLSERKKGE